MEWTVVTVFGILAGTFVTVGAPIIRAVTALTKLTSEVTYLRESMSETNERNDDSHKKICEHIETQGGMLQNHEIRLFVLEEKKKEDG